MTHPFLPGQRWISSGEPDLGLGTVQAVNARTVTVGFAAETEDLEQNARAKLERKGVDFLVANDVSRKDIAFDSQANEVTVFRRDGEPVFFPRRPKSELAGALLDLFAVTLTERATSPDTSPR